MPCRHPGDRGGMKGDGGGVPVIVKILGGTFP